MFSGIGAFRKALINLEIPYRIVGISEIDKFAIKSYEAMYGRTRNYGDISEVEKLDYADLWTYGFPCQDISQAGKQAGIIKGKTRSGLLYEVERLLEKSVESNESPKYLIMENVKALVGKKFRLDFNRWVWRLNELGYYTWYKVINAADYGIPQKRERVIAVSIRKDLHQQFKFPSPIPLKFSFRDALEEHPDSKYFLSNEMYRFCLEATSSEKRCIQIARLYGKPMWKRDNIARVYSPDGLCPTIVTNGGGHHEVKILDKSNVRRLTPKECFRLMGFSDSDYEKAHSVCSDTQLYKQAGNSIVVGVIEAILKQLLCQGVNEEHR